MRHQVTTTSPSYPCAVRVMIADENDEPIENLKVVLHGRYTGEREYEMDWKRITDWNGECIFGDLACGGDYSITVIEPKDGYANIVFTSERFYVDGSFEFRLQLK